MQDFITAIRARVLVSDGAKGTMLQARGLAAGHCPDEWNLARPDEVRAVHAAYRAAGAEVLVTNTFNALRPKLALHGLDAKLDAICAAGVALARGAGGPGAYVAASVPPSGRFVAPVGDVPFDEAVAWYREAAVALHRAGADLFWLETFTDLLEIKAAMVGIREASDRPIVAMMTFDASFRTLLGTPPQVAAIALEKLGACAVGANCSLGVEGILGCLRMMREVTPLPFVSQPNAGMPVLTEGVTVYPETPDRMAAFIPDLLAAGVRVVGGCCGTNPDHVRAHAAAVKAAAPGPLDRLLPPRPRRMYLASRTRMAACGPGEPVMMVGERINPTGRRKFGEKLLAGSMETVLSEARAQRDAGADVLDVNMGVAGGDETALMARAVPEVQQASGLPVAVDSTSIAALEAGLRAVVGRPLINSLNGEKARLEAVLPLARKYGAACVVLCLDDCGIPADAGARLAIARRIEERAAAFGLGRDDLIFDFLTLSAAASPAQAQETIEAVRRARADGMLTVLGTSNVSFGLPARDHVNAAFTSMAVGAGLDAAILNPRHEEAVRSLAAAALLAGRDAGAQRYLSHFKGAQDRQIDSKAAAKTDVMSRLQAAVLDGTGAAIVPIVEEALAGKAKPLEISARGLMPGMMEVGRLFKQNAIFLPQVLMAAETMQAAMQRLERELGARGDADSPLVLLATVEGDIHDLGKGIVAALLRNSGFRVIDAGRSVPSAVLIAAAKAERPAVVGLSALMTTTMVRMKDIVSGLRAAGVDAPVMVGGAVVTKEYAEAIGAHYGADAVAAIDLARKLAGTR